MQTFSVIFFWLAMGLATAYFANQRGRDPFVWFVLGMLLGVFGLLLLLMLPPVKEEEAVQEAEYVFHDKKEELPTQSHSFMLQDWYYYDRERRQQGPVRYDSLRDLWQEGKIDEETFVWSEGLDEWKRLDKVDPLYGELKGSGG